MEFKHFVRSKNTVNERLSAQGSNISVQSEYFLISTQVKFCDQFLKKFLKEVCKKINYLTLFLIFIFCLFIKSPDPVKRPFQISAHPKDFVLTLS